MDKHNKGFARPPINEHEKEMRAKKFLSGATNAGDDPEERDVRKVAVTLRIPEYYVQDIDRIHRLTGQTKNAIYIEILRNAIKNKLKELEEK